MPVSNSCPFVIITSQITHVNSGTNIKVVLRGLKILIMKTFTWHFAGVLHSNAVSYMLRAKKTMLEVN